MRWLQHVLVEHQPIAGQIPPRPQGDPKVTHSTEPIVSTINGARTAPIQFHVWNAGQQPRSSGILGWKTQPSLLLVNRQHYEVGGACNKTWRLDQVRTSPEVLQVPDE